MTEPADVKVQTKRRVSIRIPFAIHREAWEVYAAKYGRDQSAERLAERGGFSEEEMDAFRPGWREFATETPHMLRPS